MLRLLADENLNHDLVRGVLRRRPDLSLVSVREVGLGNVDDGAILEWAARERRLVRWIPACLSKVEGRRSKVSIHRALSPRVGMGIAD